MASRPRRRWLILTHDNPDPDALASAAALAQILKRRYRVSATVGYGGIIGRAENAEMVRALHLRLSRVRHLSWKHYRHFALVDTQPRTGNNQLPGRRRARRRDRPPPAAQGIARGRLRRHPPRLRRHRVDPDRVHAGGRPRSPSPSLATALIYAIRTETQDFRREGQSADHDLYDYLYPLVNKRALGRIQHPNLPTSYFRTLHQALERMQGVDNVIICHLPETPTPDNVPQIADLLLRTEGKTWCARHRSLRGPHLARAAHHQLAGRRRARHAAHARPQGKGRRPRHHGGRLAADRAPRGPRGAADGC